VAERTFRRVRRFLLESLAAYPRVGVFRSGRDIYEAVIPHTPFVAFYRIDTAADVLTVVAFFHHAQDRESEWGKR
jgi:plasmid stabilization system protein ParE